VELPIVHDYQGSSGYYELLRLHYLSAYGLGSNEYVLLFMLLQAHILRQERAHMSGDKPFNFFIVVRQEKRKTRI
jgi:hypothetical protein